MSVVKRPNGRWRARYRDADNREHSKDFRLKVEADKWLTGQRATVDSGLHIDPRAGLVTVKEYGELWRGAQVHRETTRALVDSQLRLHVYEQLGGRSLSSLRRSEIQAWVRGRAQVLEPRTVRQVYRLLATILRSAVEDRLLAVSPCSKIALPRVDPVQLEPLTVENVEKLTAKMPERYRALLVMMAGTGLRPGEAFGVTVDRIDFLRRRLRVDRQIVMVTGPPAFEPPKTAASVRVIPLPQVVVDALAAHIAAHPPGENGLLFTAPAGGPIRRNRFNEAIWQPTVKAAGMPKGTRLHDVRHFYASLLIRHGESVKTVQARLGHASATETLNTYAHLWPDSEDRTREAVDSVLRTSCGQSPADQAEAAGQEG